jgi:hypothetical protein
MEKKEFEKTIIYEELAKTNDFHKFMFKSYLDCLLNGGKIRESCSLYSVGRVNAECIGQEKPLTFEIEKYKKRLIELFKQFKKDKQWTTQRFELKQFDENGKEIDQEDYNTVNVVSKSVEITTKTTYYLDKKLDIKPLKR